jgi:crotonobetainyl-CoA:carnitine CoA-transferase CaiB-like acyl-CoA transferase
MLRDSYNLIKDVPVEVSQVPFSLSSFGGYPESRGRPPALGEHTIEILCEQGYSTETIESLFDNTVVYDERNTGHS